MELFLFGGLGVTLLALWIANAGRPVTSAGYWASVKRHNARREYLRNNLPTTMFRK